MHVPARALAIGVPATVRPDAARLDAITIAAAEYVKNGRRYRAHLRRLD
jgi:carbonic anhydrase/acetyltransferase-like protein (isoleucine patch superfamily)